MENNSTYTSDYRPEKWNPYMDNLNQSFSLIRQASACYFRDLLRPLKNASDQTTGKGLS